MITPSFGLTATERVLPKLALDFTTASLDSRVTFTRTTGASNPATYVDSSGVITAATNNQPRFDYDPATLTCKGLLIEESRTNYVVNSVFGGAVAGTPGTAPTSWSQFSTGTLTSVQSGRYAGGNSLTITTSASRVFYSTSYSASANTTYTGSLYVTVSSGNVTLWDLIASGGAPTGTIITYALDGVVTAGTTLVPVGSHKVNVFFAVAGTAGSITMRVGLGCSGNSTGVATIDTPQLEAGAFATSYIPTTTTALTRNADVATMTGTNFSDWFNASEGGAVIQVLPSTISGTRPAVKFDDNTANETIVLRGVAADPQLYVVDGGAAQATLDAGTITANAAYRLAGAWKSSSFATAINGAASVSQLSGTYPTVTQARFGSDGTNYLNGWLQNFTYWPQRITNAETQAFSK